MKFNEIIALIIFFLVLIFINHGLYTHFNYVQEITNSIYTYPLDDTYIHLAVSKNLTFFGNWGITPYEFSSTSSSPLFTIILSFLMFIFGNNVLIPLWFNIILGNLIVLSIFLYFKNSPVKLLWIYLGLILLVLINVQILSGMEHILHIFLIINCWLSFYYLVKSNFENKRLKIVFLTTITLVCLARYESMFFVVPLLMFLLYKKKYKLTLIVFLLFLIPIIIFGLFSIYNDGYFFPNSLLIKGKTSLEIHILFNQLKIAFKPLFLTLFLLIFILLLAKINFKNNFFIELKNLLINNSIFLIVFLAFIGHTIFASFGWLYRYEAYLIFLLITTIALLADNELKKKLLFLIPLFIIVGFFLQKSYEKRYVEAGKIMKYANKNIFDQQIQMSNFVHKYYNSSIIKANDVGAISYFSRIHLIDLVGLGSTDILKKRRDSTGIVKDTRNSPPEFYDYINTLDYDVMMIYDRWFDDDKITPKIKIGELLLKNNTICGGDIVSFYAPNEDKAVKLKKSLVEFLKDLPKDVELVLNPEHFHK
jgi:hypothetical protein